MATMSLYLFVAGGLALAFAFACHVAYTTILAQSGVALPAPRACHRWPRPSAARRP